MDQGARLLVAFVLGIPGVLLLFLLGEGISIPGTVPGADHIHVALMVVGLASFFFTSQSLLSRGHPDAARRDWPILVALNLVILLTAGTALVIEANKSAALQVAEAAPIALMSSYAGAWFAAHRARTRVERPN